LLKTEKVNACSNFKVISRTTKLLSFLYIVHLSVQHFARCRKHHLCLPMVIKQATTLVFLVMLNHCLLCTRVILIFDLFLWLLYLKHNIISHLLSEHKGTQIFIHNASHGRSYLVRMVELCMLVT